MVPNISIFFFLAQVAAGSKRFMPKQVLVTVLNIS
jgi:hypothetical protein